MKNNSPLLASRWEKTYRALRFSSLVTKSRPWPVIGRTIFFTSDKNRRTNQKPAITYRDEIYFIDFWRENLSMYRINHISHCGFEILNGSCVLAVMSTIILLRREAFIDQLVRASHRYHKVTGSNPVEVLVFFQAARRISMIALIIINMKKFLLSDWLRAVQFFC